MIEAFHSLWTKPFLFDKYTTNYYMDDYKILVMIISALKWREKNGPIRLITDTIGAKYIKELQLDFLYDAGIYETLDYIPKEINPDYYFAAGKLFALQNIAKPIVMLDMDLIVWNTLLLDKKHSNITVIHSEEITKEIYPDSNYFNSNYLCDLNLDWNVKPLNTAFLYFNHNDLLKYYTKISIEFMINNIPKDKIKDMVFAEQRLLAMCAKNKKAKINIIYSLQELQKQKNFTHIWGYKKNLYKNKENINFCKGCLKRVIKDYPYMVNNHTIKRLNHKYFHIYENNGDL